MQFRDQRQCVTILDGDRIQLSVVQRDAKLRLVNRRGAFQHTEVGHREERRNWKPHRAYGKKTLLWSVYTILWVV